MPTDTTEILTDIMNNDPKPYPEINLALHDISNLHSQCGRRFELSMLYFTIVSCDCCGTVQPSHIDPTIKGVVFPFKNKTFNLKLKDVWKCSCAEVCNGEQFYLKGSKL